MKTLALLLIAASTLVLASCAHDYNNPSVEASNGVVRDATGVRSPLSAAGGAGGETLAGERARKSEAFNKLPQ